MAENIVNPAAEEERRCSEPVCIDARRVYDSCGDKDCMSDMPVFFTDDGQDQIDNAVNVRLRDAQVINVMLDIEPVPFHRGFYSIDMTFFFEVTLDVFSSPCNTPACVKGLCISDKKVILYGSEGNVQVFSSDMTTDEYDMQGLPTKTLPTANVQVAQPIALAAVLIEKRPCHKIGHKVPSGIVTRFGGEMCDRGEKVVLATLGVFSIVQLMRNVQMLIPSYDYCVPEKRCTGSTDDSPCEVFSRLDFPTDEFFPPNVTDCGGESSSSGCSCNS